MMSISVGSLFFGLVALLASLYNWAGISFEDGRFAFSILLGISIVSFVSALVFGKSKEMLNTNIE